MREETKALNEKQRISFKPQKGKKMAKHNFNDSWDETLNVCSIFERITGKTLHHGETDYDLTPVYEQMERDMTLVDEIIRAGGAEAEYAERIPTLPIC